MVRAVSSRDNSPSKLFVRNCFARWIESGSSCCSADAESLRAKSFNRLLT